MPSAIMYLPFCQENIKSSEGLEYLGFLLVTDLKSKPPPTVGLNPSGMVVTDLKYKSPPTVGLNPSGMVVTELKYKPPPTVGLNPPGMVVTDLKSKPPFIFSSP